jgi:hypothetical protein
MISVHVLETGDTCTDFLRRGIYEMYCVREAGAGYRQCGGGPGNRSAEAGRDPVQAESV